MALSLWTLGDIKTKLRNLCGRASTNQLSDADLIDYINRYYQLQFPLEARPNELYTWFSFDVSDGVDEYDLTSQTDADTSEIFEDGFLTLDYPATVDGYNLIMYTDPALFYERWPETTTYGESRPTDVLYYDRTLTFRYTPDDTYTVKFSAIKKPTALASDTGYPMMEEWGACIAYGASIEVLQDVADIGRIEEITPFYEKHLYTLMRKVQAQDTNIRSVPTF